MKDLNGEVLLKIFSDSNFRDGLMCEIAKARKINEEFIKRSIPKRENLCRPFNC